MKVQILTENRAHKRGILAEHGLSMIIEHENKRLLFDMGQTDVFVRNAKEMGADLANIDGVIFSHGHYDHCGGLVHFPKNLSLPKMYMHENAFVERYAISTDENPDPIIGIEWSAEEYAPYIAWNSKNLEIGPGLSLLSDIPFTTDFEEPPKNFYIMDGKNKKQDTVGDEQMLVIEGEKGLSVFLGCSHRGVINFLRHALSHFQGKPIYSLVAGMHLEKVSPERLARTIDCFKDLQIQKVVPFHCTGIEAICEIKRALGDRCLLPCAGDSFIL